MELTTAGHGLSEGDVVTMPIQLSWWSRFLIWLVAPLRWPPKTWPGPYIVTGVINSSTVEIERKDEDRS